MAYGLEVSPREHVLQLLRASELESLPAPRVFVALRPWHGSVSAKDWMDSVRQSLTDLLLSTGGSVVFVAFDQAADTEGGDDRDVARAIAVRLPHRERVRVIDVRLTASEMAGTLALADVVVAMRRHAAIFAALSGIPVIGLAYDDKVRYALEELGQSRYCLPLDVTHQKMTSTVRLEIGRAHV